MSRQDIANSRHLSKLAEQSNFKAVLNESNKLLKRNPNDPTILIYKALGLALSPYGKTKAVELLTACLEVNPVKSKAKDYYVMTSNDFTNAIVACNSSGCNKILGKIIIQYLEDVPHKLDYDLTLFAALIDNLLWSLEFTLAKSILLLLKKHFSSLKLSSEIIDMRLILIIYMELFHADALKNKQKHAMYAKILENKVRSFIKSSQGTNNTDVKYVLASLCFENAKFLEGLSLIDEAESMNNANNKKSLIIQNHNIYGFTLAYRGKNFDKALHYLKNSLKNENFDSNFLDLIFGLKECEDDDSSLIVTDEFVNQVRQVIANINCSNDESKQYKLLFEFNVLLREFVVNSKSKDEVSKKIVEFIQSYFDTFSSKPFCAVDLRCFASKLFGLDEPAIGLDLLKKFIESKIDSLQLSSLNSFDCEKDWLENANKFMNIQWFRFSVGVVPTIDQILCQMQEWYDAFFEAKSITKNDAEKMYPFCQLILLSASMLDYHSIKSQNIQLALAALSLLMKFTCDGDNDSYFMFKVKQQLIMNRIGIPGLSSLITQLEFNDTQFDALFYLFLPQFTSMNIVHDFGDFILMLLNKFEEIRKQVNQMYANLHSYNITLLYEDYAEFTLKTIKSRNKNLTHLFYELHEGLKSMNFSNMSSVCQFERSLLDDINDYTICEFFTPLNEPDIKLQFNQHYDEFFNEIDSIQAGYHSYKSFFERFFLNSDQSPCTLTNDLNINNFACGIESIVSFSSRLITLLQLHKSHFKPSSIAPNRKNGKKNSESPNSINYHAIIHKINDHFNSSWTSVIDEFESKFSNDLLKLDIGATTNALRKHISLLSKNILKNKNKF